MESKKKYLQIGLIFICIIFIGVIIYFFCFGRMEKKDVYGGEQVNYEFVARETNYWTMTLAAKSSWVEGISDVYMNFSQGEAKFEYTVNDTGEKISDYTIYNIDFVTSEYKFENNKEVIIDNISFVSNDKEYTIKPQKIAFQYLDWTQKNYDDLYFSASPLKIPSDMNELPIQLSTSTKHEVHIDEIIITNQNMSPYEIEGHKDGTVKLLPGVKEEDLSIVFDKKNLEEHTAYGTDLIIKYTVDNKQYILVPEICTIYNPIDSNILKRCMKK